MSWEIKKNSINDDHLTSRWFLDFLIFSSMNSRKSMYKAYPSAFSASILKPSKTPLLFSEQCSTYCGESQVRVPLRPKTIRLEEPN